jgi:hypothetical protein
VDVQSFNGGVASQAGISDSNAQRLRITKQIDCTKVSGQLLYAFGAPNDNGCVHLSVMLLNGCKLRHDVGSVGSLRKKQLPQPGSEVGSLHHGAGRIANETSFSLNTTMGKSKWLLCSNSPRQQFPRLWCTSDATTPP